ncbi:MAG: VWA domain-containing protein [Acidobacteria bacterium]|nr:MAG: VWA domain-containing protein [Acidobacteriota bacterium]
MKRTRRLLFAAALACVMSLGVIAGQQTPPPSNPPAQSPPATQAPPPQGQEAQRPTFRAEANFVRVDVYPTVDGRPVMDLTQNEFQVLEDGVPQQIASFEHVVVQAAGAQEARVEPNNVRESKEMARDARARLFVLFVDTYHVSGPSGYNVRGPLVRMLDRVIGQDDLIAVMTPEMSAAAVTFARKTHTIEEVLGKYWEYGKRQREVGYDPEENNYISCYPPEGTGTISEIAREMINRRREKMTLDALADLVVHLGGLREERKAIFAISEGWMLYRPNSALARPTGPNSRVPGPPPVGTGPDGRLRMGDLGRSSMGTDLNRCDQDRIRLAQEDHDQDFRRMLDMANRANASFYPIDPRGLPVFDSPIGPEAPPSPVVDQAMLRERIETLRTLAVATDGLAIVNSNDIDRGLKRVVDDLSSYYLLGYYSSNSKLDGRFRSIGVKVKRSGVSVRARRGYLAATREEAEARAAAASSPAAPNPSSGTGLLSALGRIRGEAFVQAIAGYEWRGEAGTPGAALWVNVELDPGAGTRDEQWKAGAEVTLAVTGPDRKAVGEVKHLLTREARLARLIIPAAAPLAPGDYAIRVSSKPAGATIGTSEVIRVTVPDPAAGGPLVTGQPSLWRRGPFSGAGWQPAGDLRFRRQERVRVEIPVFGASGTASARLLDRNGKPLGVPITAGERDENGGKVVTAELTLAPLGAGDYLVETTIEAQGTTKKILAAFRIINS